MIRKVPAVYKIVTRTKKYNWRYPRKHRPNPAFDELFKSELSLLDAKSTPRKKK